MPLTVQAQRSIEVFGGGGFTSGDAKKWSGARLDDWNQTYYDGHAQLFLGKVLGARVGIEAGHNYLMWYRWNSCPGCISPVYGNRDVEASRLMAVFRFDSPTRLFAEFAGGMQFFDGGNDMGGFAGVGYRVPLMGKLELPIKLRAGMVLDSDANLFPVALSAGLAFRM
jgi:hypothetical protein